MVKGTLTGLTQHCDRAELRGIIAAIEWGLALDKPLTIWSDSSYATDGLHRLLHDCQDVPDSSNDLDWRELQCLIISAQIPIFVQHIPGHSATGHPMNDVEAWTAQWNDRVDREAQMAQKLHGPTLTCFHRLWTHHNQEVKDLCCLQSFHIDVSERFIASDPILDEDQEDWGCDPADLMVERGCPDSPNPLAGLQIHDQEARTTLEQKFGAVFTRWMLDWMNGLATNDDVQLAKVSYLELAAFVMPRIGSSRQNCWCDRGVVGASEPTVGAVLRLVKMFMQLTEHCFSLAFPRWQRLSLVRVGVHTPQAGQTFPIDFEFSRTVTQALCGLTQSRPIRTVNDLSRPLWR